MTSPNNDDKKGGGQYSKFVNDSGPFIGSGIQLAAAVVIMYFIGRWVDTKFESTPWGMTICLFFGVAAGMVKFIRDVLAFDKKKQSKNA